MNVITTWRKAYYIILYLVFAPLSADEASYVKGTPETKDLVKDVVNEHNLTTMPARQKPPFPGGREVELLRSLLDAPPERLKILKKTIERVELMSPQKKKEIKKRLRQLKESPPHIRAHELGRLKRRQMQLNNYWQGMSPKDRQNEIKAFRALSLVERESYFKSVIKNKKGT
jgi:hypothetical protein